MVIKKRQLLMATLVIALGSAVFINWYYTKPNVEAGADNKPGTSQGEKQSTGENLGDARYVNGEGTTQAAAEVMKREYFASAKLRRSTAHEEAKQALQKIISDKNADNEAIKSANKALAEIAKAIKQEGDSENLITAKIGGDCLVILNGDSAEVIVEKDVLNEQVALQIKDIMMTQTKLPAEKITIVERNG